MICKFPKDKKEAAAEAVNACNNDFRYAKFFINEEREIMAEYDFPTLTKNPDEIAVEMTRRFMNIIDDAYPRLMKAIYG